MRSPSVFDLAPQKPNDHLMVVNVSGRGDKDLDWWPSIWKARSDERVCGTRAAHSACSLPLRGRVW